jgi:single-strand DNA-binding protein
MASLTNVTVLGNLVRDPEVKAVGSTSVCEFAVAVNETWKDRDGQKQEHVSYFDVKVWGKQGDACAQYLAKGRSVLVLGTLRQDRWEAADGSGNRSRVYVRADSVTFLGGPKAGDSVDGPEDLGGLPDVDF